MPSELLGFDPDSKENVRLAWDAGMVTSLCFLGSVTTPEVTVLNGENGKWDSG